MPSRRGTRSRCGSTPRIRARSSRRRAGSSGCGFPAGIRVDAGVDEGDEVGVAYDPLIAKLIAHGPTRDEALFRLQDALAETVVEGLTTNLPFLRWLVAHPARARRPDDDGVPLRLPAALRSARAAAERPLGRRVAAEPSGAARRIRRPTWTTRRTTAAASPGASRAR